MIERVEIEEDLARVREELVRMKDEREKFMKELQLVKNQKLMLESQIEESQCTVEELEKKIISAVELLITFKERRDKMRMERGNAVREVEQLRRLMKGSSANSGRSELPVFSFMEINEATNDFDPSWKIAEGRFGSVYKGLLHHMHVAIKMLPSYGSNSQLDFLHEVILLARFIQCLLIC